MCTMTWPDRRACVVPLTLVGAVGCGEGDAANGGGDAIPIPHQKKIPPGARVLNARRTAATGACAQQQCNHCGHRCGMFQFLHGQPPVLWTTVFRRANEYRPSTCESHPTREDLSLLLMSNFRWNAEEYSPDEDPMKPR